MIYSVNVLQHNAEETDVKCKIILNFEEKNKKIKKRVSTIDEVLIGIEWNVVRARRCFVNGLNLEDGALYWKTSTAKFVL